MNRRIDRDLDAIILKCMEKDPNRRYPDAGALGGDLHRYLASEPVEARRWGARRRPVTFVGKSGRRCNERAFVEFYHDEPYGIGGEATVENIKLLCRAHNAFESERFHGHGRPMKSATLPGKSSPTPPPIRGRPISAEGA